MKIGIAGYGFVGQAHEYLLNEFYEILISDPDKGHYADLQHADAIIVCVSTPSRVDGSCEVKNVYEVIESAPDVPILIKSTLSVEGWKAIVDTFPNRNITYSPEFLRAASWQSDIKNTTNIYLGGNSTNFWSDVFLKVYGKVNISPESPAELVAAKVFRNSFLALKVSFFNQVYDYCKAHDLNFTDAQHFICSDKRIGHGHSDVTAERGYGGHCLPKDVKAAIRSAQAYGTRLTLLEEADLYNNSVRKS